MCVCVCVLVRLCVTATVKIYKNIYIYIDTQRNMCIYTLEYIYMFYFVWGGDVYCTYLRGCLLCK